MEENKNVADNQTPQNKYVLDYSLDPQAKIEVVQKIIDNATPEQLTPKYLAVLTNYILEQDKEERKQKNILTDNRLVTINKRETSYQGLVAKLENGEDGLYNMMAGNDKNILFSPKVSITKKDLEEIPPLRELRKSIESIEEQIKKAGGKRKFSLTTQLIEMRQEQYVIKNEYRQPRYSNSSIKSINQIDLSENYYIDAAGDIQSNGIITFLNEEHISALLCNYSKLRQEAWGNFWGDIWYMMEDLDNLIEVTLKDEYPLYYDILIHKIDGRQNVEIQELILEKHGVKHSVEYISSLWRKKIPKLLARKAQEQAIEWYYTEKERGQWKQCTRCGEIKLAHNLFFSKNRGSRDGYYSICKCCRNKKK